MTAPSDWRQIFPATSSPPVPSLSTSPFTLSEIFPPSAVIS
jgi:hypothetical protein